MLNILTADQRAAASSCLDVEMRPCPGPPGLYDCVVHVIEPDTTDPMLPYRLLRASIDDVEKALNDWAVLHRGPAQRPLPVFFRNVEPTVLALFPSAV